MKTLPLLAGLLCLGTLPLNARAALIITSGTLHAAAFADSGSNSDSDNPPDKTLVLPSTTISADAMTTSEIFGTSQAHVDATVGQNTGGTISIDANTSITGNGTGRSSGAGATGSIALTENVSETVTASMGALNSPYGFGSVALRDASNNLVMQLGVNSFSTAQSQSAALAPGNYTIAWQFSAQGAGGQGGPASMHYALAPVSEPSSLLILLFPMLVLPRARTHGELR